MFLLSSVTAPHATVWEIPKAFWYRLDTQAKSVHFRRATWALARISSTVEIPIKRQTTITYWFLCITLQLHQVSQSSIVSTDGTSGNKVKACWPNHTVLTLLPISSRLFPGLLLLSLMEGERSRFLIRLVIVDPSTDIISRCQEDIHPTHKLCLGNKPRFEAEILMCSALLTLVHISLSDSARELHSCYTAKLFTEAGRLSFCRFQRIKSAVI